MFDVMQSGRVVDAKADDREVRAIRKHAVERGVDALRIQ